MTDDVERRARIGKALELIGRNRARRVEVERSVRFIDGMKTHLAANHPANKKAKTAASRVAGDLRKLVVDLKDRHLEAFVRDYFAASELQSLRAHCEALAKFPHPPNRRGRGDDAKRLAAAEAAILLDRHGLPLTVGRGSLFCKLAAVLYGEARADFFHYCTSAKKARNGV
jgi:hypothetical protein